MTDYLGYPIFDPTPRESISTGQISPRLVAGESWHRRDVVPFGPADATLRTTLLLATRSERYAVEEHFRAMRGREGLFWLPSFRPVLELAVAANLGAASIDYADTGELFSLAGRTTHIWLPDYSQAHELGYPTDLGGGLLRSAVDPVLAQDVAAAAPVWALWLVAFASDELEIRARGGLVYNDGSEVHEVAEVALDVIEAQANTPEA